ncbi:hypothetical protein C1H46_026822 [Malus baccata]|uniref:Reverse transcriptase Ty1/copia-type domain-containing protein n=1 Tax=Malus baccata TaxID=106549 RepID=A0A540LMC7_MALBA|nr:hypothetical protein C1H46_026822 [Malus baccata]
MFLIKLRRSLYGLKQSEQMWYNRLSDYLIKEGYANNVICPCQCSKTRARRRLGAGRRVSAAIIMKSFNKSEGLLIGV